MVAVTGSILHQAVADAQLKCSECGKSYGSAAMHTYATCERCEKNPLLVQYYNLPAAKERIRTGLNTMWRYGAWLPPLREEHVISLGEGGTPLLTLGTLSREIGIHRILLKDESVNPTGSFKARGLSMAVSKAKERGVRRCIIPTAGNAGVALAAYCAKAGIESVIVMPRHTPQAFKDECELYGAVTVYVDGLISDCARRVAALNADKSFFDMSTMKEPYRLEGKKTMGYEIAEQLNWSLPDVILYPTGGGTGLIGIWKAFQEMHALGWIKKPFPRMIAVQADACKPVANTWRGLQKDSRAYQGKSTIAYGLAVPNPFAEKLILSVLRESDGTVETVTDQEMIAAVAQIASKEGLFLAPEGAALYCALKKLLHRKMIREQETVLMLNTGSGQKYSELFQSIL